jgi:hypothetical protein
LGFRGWPVGQRVRDDLLKGRNGRLRVSDIFLR